MTLARKFAKLTSMDLRKHWTMQKLAQAAAGKLLQGAREAPVKGVGIDSRKLRKGDVFWALEGARHGDEFVEDAFINGAAGAVVSKPLPFADVSKHFALIQVGRGLASLTRFAAAHRALFPKLKVVAVTGSNGKTSTKEMIARVLAKKGKTVQTVGNFNNEIGCSLSLLEIDDVHEFGVFELAARKKGDIEPLTKLVGPQVAVLTNISGAHLETFGSVENVWQTKSEILKGLGPGGCVIYWAEDPWLAKLPALGLPRKHLSFGFGPSAHVRGMVRALSSESVTVEVFYQAESLGTVALKVIGDGPVRNALAAVACGLHFGVKVKDIFAALASFEPVAMRGERLYLGSQVFDKQYVVVNDAYNANPESMYDSVMGFLRAYRSGGRILVLGEMRELGLDEVRLHSDTATRILQSAQEQGLTDAQTVFIFTGGVAANAMAAVMHAAPKETRAYESFYAPRGEVFALIKSKMFLNKPPCAVFFKASRAEALEDIIHEVKKEF